MALVRVNQLIGRHWTGTGFVEGVVKKLRVRAVAVVTSTASFTAYGAATLAATAAVVTAPITANALAAPPLQASAALTVSTVDTADFTITAPGPYNVVAFAELESNPHITGDADVTWMVGVARCHAVPLVRADAANPEAGVPWYVLFGMAEAGAAGNVFTTPRAKYTIARAACFAANARHILSFADPIVLTAEASCEPGMSITQPARAAVIRGEAEVTATDLRDYVWATGVVSVLDGNAVVHWPQPTLTENCPADPLRGQAMVVGGPTITTPSAAVAAQALVTATPKPLIVNSVNSFWGVAETTTDGVELIPPGARMSATADVTAGAVLVLTGNESTEVTFRRQIGWTGTGEPRFETATAAGVPLYWGAALVGQVDVLPSFNDTGADQLYGDPAPFTVRPGESHVVASFTTPTASLIAEAEVTAASSGDILVCDSILLTGAARCETPGPRIGFNVFLIAKSETAWFPTSVLVVTNEGDGPQTYPSWDQIDTTWDTMTLVWDAVATPWEQIDTAWEDTTIDWDATSTPPITIDGVAAVSATATVR